MMGRRFILVPALVFGLAGHAAAQPGEPSTANISTAMSILEVTHAKANMTKVLDFIAPKIFGIVRQQNPALDEATLVSFEAAFKEEFQASVAGELREIAKIYVRHFSKNELETILAFYRTDTGKKLISEMPKVLQESMTLGESWGRTAGMLAAQRAAARLKDKGIKI